MTRTRFSPSPTGRLHLGNARAALFCDLYAAKHQGSFILRIEDTDLSRSEGKYSELLQDDLHWLGIYWQEGPGVGGKYGPYWQSQRQSIYAKYYSILEAANLIYPCFCTDQELAIARKLKLSQGQAPRYSGTCLKLSPEEISERLKQGKKPAWRFKIPLDEVVEFVDLVKGPQRFLTNDIGDFIVRRVDQTAPFLFCNAIDDATMKVTQVLRGEDHLSNTPRQILILKALNLGIPQYGHLPMIVGEDGAPLSKRHGSYSLEDLQRQGFLALAIINYLGRLGHVLETQELLSVDRMAIDFNLEKISRSPARFDVSQLLFWQKMAVQDLMPDDFWRWIGEEALSQIPQSKKDLFLKTIKANVIFPKDVLFWIQALFQEDVQVDDQSKEIILSAEEQFFVEAELAFDKYGTDLPAVLKEMQKTLGVSGKKLFMPLRIALTGTLHGPELAAIVELLGKERIKHRLSEAFKMASKG